ncbi:MAG: tetratricopeptide repeat-containing sulfotransferase family protein [Alphaproteobacteria bacterium]
MTELPFSTLMERGIDAHRHRRVEEALERYRAALELRPGDAEANSLYGLALVHLGRPAEAESLLRKAVEAEPDQIGFRLNLAECLEATGRFAEAAREIERVVSTNPQFARGWEKSGDISVALEDQAEAAKAYSRALQLDAQNSTVALKLARALLDLSDSEGARMALDHAAQHRPPDRLLLSLYAETFLAQRDWRRLEGTAQNWTRVEPGNPAVWRALATAAFEQGRYRAALDAFRKVLELTPKSAQILSTYGQICLHAAEYDAGAQALAEAEALDPGLAETLAARGLLLTYAGRFEEAEEYCNRCIQQDPEHVPVYTVLSRLKRGRLTEEQMATLARLAEMPGFPLEHRIAAAFALGHAHDARQEFERAFTTYERANELGRELSRQDGISYDPAAAEARRERLVKFFPGPAAEGAERPPGPRPLFIAGMPRSGTTLLEGVLSAHSRVFACGERPMMRQIVDACLDWMAAREGREPPPEMLREWAAAYFGELPDLGGADHVTDKLPLNFEAAGLIARMFPDAVILHVRRNPVETGFSIFRHEFSRLWTFAHRLEDIGHYYGQYARLAAHWERTLGSRFHTIQYEAFAADFGRAAPELVKACGLEWEDACRSFQQAERPIATFSSVQAREPVTVRNGRAEDYRDQLAPLVEALRAARVDLDTGALVAEV